jgi:hypothetical protein
VARTTERTVVGHVVLELLVWLTGFGIIWLAWKRRLPMEVALLSDAVILAVAWGSPLAVAG